MGGGDERDSGYSICLIGRRIKFGRNWVVASHFVRLGPGGDELRQRWLEGLRRESYGCGAVGFSVSGDLVWCLRSWFRSIVGLRVTYHCLLVVKC